MSTAAVIAKNLKLLRKINKITQQDLSSLLDLNYRHYQSIEAGRVDLKLSTLERLADHFKVPIQCFFGPGLSMAEMQLDAFNFPDFLVQVCDPEGMNFLSWCQGTREITGLDSMNELTPISFAYPIQEGRKKAGIILDLMSHRALERGESHFVWRTCSNEAGKICFPDHVHQISCFNITMVASKSGAKDVLIAFAPRKIELMPLP